MKCKWCGKSFETNRVGRPPLYCCKSHKQRAYESRRYRIGDIWESLRAEFQDCYLCGQPLDYAAPQTLCLDHMISTVYGGRTDVENLRPVHLKCNARKGFKLISSPFMESER